MSTADLDLPFLRSLKWSADGLIPAIVQDADSGEVLMMAWMDEPALRNTLTTGQTHFYSRSRKASWHKGGTSGHVQHVESIRLDCDGDVLLVRARQVGGACHEGYRSCFWRRVDAGGRLEVADVPVFRADEVYGNKGPTTRPPAVEPALQTSAEFPLIDRATSARSSTAGPFGSARLPRIASMSTVLNFNAGPAALPRTVLEKVQAELLDYQGKGMSIMEMSHRSKEYEAINTRAEANFKRLIGVDDGYRVLFVQGGASGQFSTVPMNFLPKGGTADYLVSGTWGEKAIEEAALFGTAHLAASTKEGGYRKVPTPFEIHFSQAPSYVHMTSNETIQGVQYPHFPDLGDLPLVADMSSDILSRPIDARKFALIYAGAQKNLGPSGVTVVLIRESLLERANKGVPTMLRYSTHAKNNSLYNTPPMFGVYVLDLVLQWVDAQGGVAGIAATNEAKAAALYDTIDQSGGYYKGHAEPGSRSRMNVTFRLPGEELEKQFVAEGQKAGMVGLAGHRSVGGIRASIYNAIDLAACQSLAAFMGDFARKNG